MEEERGGLPAHLTGLTAWCTWPRFAAIQPPTRHRLALEPLHGGLGRSAVRHVHETKPPRATGVTVRNDMDRVHRAIRLEELVEFMLRRTERQMADKDIHARILW